MQRWVNEIKHFAPIIDVCYSYVVCAPLLAILCHLACFQPIAMDKTNFLNGHRRFLFPKRIFFRAFPGFPGGWGAFRCVFGGEYGYDTYIMCAYYILRTYIL